jgi:hypothetical protein
MKRIALSTFATIILLASQTQVIATSTEEQTVFDSLLDISSLRKVGKLSLKELSDRTTSTAIALDRAKRKGINSPDLESASNFYLEAESRWKKSIELRAQSLEISIRESPTPEITQLTKETIMQSSEALLELRDQSLDAADRSINQYKDRTKTSTDEKKVSKQKK